jgi:hypothetical protein
MSRPGLALCVLTALLSACAGGCSKLRQVSACRAVAREVNGAVGEIEALSHAKTVDEARIAKRYGELARALEPRSVGVTPLAGAVRDYVTVVRATETTLKSRVEAAKLPYAKSNESTRELERLVKREHAAVSRIDVECTTR